MGLDKDGQVQVNYVSPFSTDNFNRKGETILVIY